MRRNRGEFQDDFYENDERDTPVNEAPREGRARRRQAEPEAEPRARRGSSPNERGRIDLQRGQGSAGASAFHAAMPYVCLALGIFLAICLLLNLICNFGNKLAEDPSRHWMGSIGYGISYAMHGLLGFSAFFVPALLILAFFRWKKHHRNHRLLLKTLNAAVLVLTLSVVIHTFYLAIVAGEIADTPAGDLFDLGARLGGGGFLGGKLAYFLLSFLNWAGAVIVEIIFLVFTLFYLIGMTPRHILTRLRNRRALSDKDPKTLSELEAEKAKKRARKVAEEKRNQSGELQVTPEGYPAGSVTIFEGQAKPTAAAPEADYPPMPKVKGNAGNQLYLPADVRRAMREEDERERRKAAEEHQRDLLARTQAGQARRTLPAVERPMQGPTPTPAEVQASYETVDPIFPQTENKANKHVQKGDRNFDLKRIFRDEALNDTGAQEQQHAPLPPERPVTNRPAPKKPQPAPEAAVPPEKKYIFPPMDLLKRGEPMSDDNREEIEKNMLKLESTLKSFNVGVSNIEYSCGPTVTRYEITPASGVHARSITNLAGDIALNFAVKDVRMGQIEGKSAIGVEVPNRTRHTVYLRNLLESNRFQNAKGNLTVALGADVVNDPVVFDISDMPHLLIGGATKMGKSVCINGLIMSLLYRTKPDEVKLILVDPKKVEFTPYRGLPHLLAPIITSANDAAGALQAAVNEMEKRYDLIQEVGAKKLESYNEITKDDPDKPFLPYLIIIIDELADLMLQARDQVEEPICRLLQKGRASGIHLILGTQRPSVDVVTGLIKSNLPSRIACTVVSQVDSRTILDGVGAEKLLGRGDMLFAPVGSTRPERVQGAFISDHEVESVCDFIRSKNGTAVYDENFTEKMKELSSQINQKGGKVAEVEVSDEAKSDAKYLDAIRVAVEEGRMSTSLLQRKLELGYGRAAKLIDRMQAEGIVSAPDGSKPRTVLITKEEFMERFVNGGFDAEPVDEE